MSKRDAWEARIEDLQIMLHCASDERYIANTKLARAEARIAELEMARSLARIERDTLRARIAELEAEVREKNDALEHCWKVIYASQARIAELEAEVCDLVHEGNDEAVGRVYFQKRTEEAEAEISAIRARLEALADLFAAGSANTKV